MLLLWVRLTCYDVYAQDKHTDLGIIPAHRWNESLQAGFVPYLPGSVEETRMLLYCSETRTVGRHGIDFEALRYQSADLQRARTRMADADADETPQEREEREGGAQTADVARILPNRKRIRFKYDPGNIQRIYVVDPDLHKPIAIPAVDPEGYTIGMSIWKHRIVRKNALALYGKADIYDLANAHAHIREVVEDEFKKTRRTRTRATAARFLEIGTGPLPTPDTFSAAAPALDASTTNNTPKLLPEPQQPEPQAPLVSAAHAMQEAGSTPATATPAATTSSTTPATPDQPGGQSFAPTTRKDRRSSRSHKNKQPSTSAGSSAPTAALDLSRWSADYDLPYEL